MSARNLTETLLHLTVAAPRDWEAIRSVFLEAGFSQQAVTQLANRAGYQIPVRAGAVEAIWSTEPASPLEVLLRLFVAQVPLSSDVVARHLSPEVLEAWTRWGLVESDSHEHVRARFSMLAYGGYLLACDLRPDDPCRAAPDVVLSVDRSTLMLAGLTIRRPVGRVLDLGAGNGFLSLLAARHAESVVATDINPCSAAFIEFNARLNGVASIEPRLGDAFTPVVGERFDLIVMNAPFVISPSQSFIYRDSGLPGDAFLEQVVRTAGDYLHAGGVCQLLGEWIQPRGGDWKARLADWTRDSGCDVLVLRDREQSPLDYAAEWICRPKGQTPHEFARLLDEWMRYYERTGVEAISRGLVVMRKRAAAEHWIAVEEAPRVEHPPAGDTICALFAARDFLAAGASDAVLLQATWQVAPTAALEQVGRLEGGSWNLASARLRRLSGMAFFADLDAVAMSLVTRLDGTRTLRAAILETAAESGLPAEQLAPQAIRLVRSLAAKTLIFPVGSYAADAEFDRVLPNELFV